jgi:tetratricopeptide (TPR) repeat protein
MGAVFLAEQTQPVQRKVALKVIKPGMDSRQVIARFEQERQALALMDHPHIARVLDGGETPSGRPYFVRELVKGVPLTHHCDEHRLTPRERLELFIPVCQAVQHAHSKGVIHRDLKPSNVLVASYDGRAVPKVIDFGIAKATGPRLTERTLFTEFGAVVGTLEYMSPEQAQLNNLDIDTRSDVYSLGVLLYELLTGSTPLERKRLKGTALLEALRLIREEEPPRPSTRLGTTEQLPAIAAKRGVEPKKLSGLVRGELDWIVMKALDKDRNRRYETAGGLARDVERYLRDEPVQACPPTAGYRLRKLVRRHRRALATAALLGVTLLVALGSVAGGDREAQRADRGRNFQLALERAEWLQDRGKWAEAQVALERAALLAGEGESDPALQDRLGALKEDQEFVARFEEVRNLAQSQVKAEENRFVLEAAFPRLRRALEQYGIEVGVTAPAQVVARIQGRPEGVREHLIAALEECLTFLPKEEARVGRWLVTVLDGADSDLWRARVRKALQARDWRKLARLAGEVDVRKQPPSFLLWIVRFLPRDTDPSRLALCRRIQRAHPADFWANHDLALALTVGGEPAEAVRYFTAALALRPDNLGGYLNRAAALRNAGELEAARADLRRVLTLAPRYAAAHAILGSVLLALGDRKGALAACRRALALDPKLAQAHSNLGMALRARGDVKGAIAAYKRALALDPRDVAALNNLGFALRARGDLPGSITTYKRALALDPRNARIHFNLGDALRAARDGDGAIAAYRRGLALEPRHGLVCCNLGFALLQKGLLPQGIAAYEEALRVQPGLVKVQAQVNQVARVLANSPEPKVRNPEKALALARRLVQLSPQNGPHWGTLGMALYRARDWKGSIEALNRSLALRQGGDGLDWFFLAMAHAQRGYKEEARRWYDLAARWMDRLSPGSLDLRRCRAEAAALLKVDGPKAERESR